MKLSFNPLEKDPRLPAAAAAIKEWTRAALSLCDDTAVSVNELACVQPDCPPRETVILVLQSGAPATRLSIHKAIVDIDERDIDEACRCGQHLLHRKERA